MKYERPMRRSYHQINFVKSMTGIRDKKALHFPVCIIGGGPVGLLLSSQLSEYKIKHCLIERRAEPTQHPQAHFMNTRTMEILLSHLPNVFQQVIHQMPASINWR